MAGSKVWTYVPHKNEPLCLPLFIIMYVATSIFSSPRSPHAWEGIPYSIVACLNRLRTVEDRLLSLALIAVTYNSELAVILRL